MRLNRYPVFKTVKSGMKIIIKKQAQIMKQFSHTFTYYTYL